MLDLDPCIHFDEVVVAFPVNKEFNSTGAPVVDSARDLKSILAYGLSLFFGYAQSRCELHYLLMSSLYGAVSLIHVNNISVFVSEDLHFDVLRLLDVFLDKDIAVPECLYSFILSAVELRQEVLLLADDPHSSSAAACSCLEHYRVSCRIRELYRVIIVRRAVHTQQILQYIRRHICALFHQCCQILSYSLARKILQHLFVKFCHFQSLLKIKVIRSDKR